ncbi:hypothetical protein HK102_008045 [Quaeritorhiza haematococci]|nr:hypothetical protein HK102_008045 [Quaeritorhiza haematococci]
MYRWNSKESQDLIVIGTIMFVLTLNQVVLVFTSARLLKHITSRSTPGLDGLVSTITPYQASNKPEVYGVEGLSYPTAEGWSAGGTVMSGTSVDEMANATAAGEDDLEERQSQPHQQKLRDAERDLRLITQRIIVLTLVYLVTWLPYTLYILAALCTAEPSDVWMVVMGFLGENGVVVASMINPSELHSSLFMLGYVGRMWRTASHISNPPPFVPPTPSTDSMARRKT